MPTAGRPATLASCSRSRAGALIAMGEHKGSGLAIMCELLAGALTGGRTVQPAHPQAGGIINNMLSVIIDPDAFGDRDAGCSSEIAALIGYVKSARPRAGFDEVLVPGEPERRRRAERLAGGIEVDERTWTEILAAARDARARRRRRSSPDRLRHAHGTGRLRGDRRRRGRPRRGAPAGAGRARGAGARGRRA